MLRSRWVRIHLPLRFASFQNEKACDNLTSTCLPPQPPASAASPAHPLSLRHAAGQGGVSGVSTWIPTTFHLQLEQVRKERSQHLPTAHPPRPGGQLRVWERCCEGQSPADSIDLASTPSPCYCNPVALCLHPQVFSDKKLKAVLCGRRDLEELESSVNPDLVSLPGGCLSLSFYSDYSNTKRHTGFRGFYSDQGRTSARRRRIRRRSSEWWAECVSSCIVQDLKVYVIL